MAWPSSRFMMKMMCSWGTCKMRNWTILILAAIACAVYLVWLDAHAGKAITEAELKMERHQAPIIEQLQEEARKAFLRTHC